MSNTTTNTNAEIERTTVKMLESVPNAVDTGEIYGKAFVKGETYDIGPTLLESFKKLKVIEVIGKAAPKEDGNSDGPLSEQDIAQLSKLNKEKLTAYAEANKIEIKPEMNKAEIVDAIVKAKAEKKEDNA